MSVAAEAFAGMDETLFATFGEAGTVQRDGGAWVPVTVVLIRGVERLGDYGQVVGRVTTASFRNSEWQPKPGDMLAIGIATAREVETIDSDDGRVSVVVLHGHG